MRSGMYTCTHCCDQTVRVRVHKYLPFYLGCVCVCVCVCVNKGTPSWFVEDNGQGRVDRHSTVTTVTWHAYSRPPTPDWHTCVPIGKILNAYVLVWKRDGPKANHGYLPTRPSADVYARVRVGTLNYCTERVRRDCRRKHVHKRILPDWIFVVHIYCTGRTWNVRMSHFHEFPSTDSIANTPVTAILMEYHTWATRSVVNTSYVKIFLTTWSRPNKAYNKITRIDVALL
jgi:hypothetical protein